MILNIFVQPLGDTINELSFLPWDKQTFTLTEVLRIAINCIHNGSINKQAHLELIHAQLVREEKDIKSRLPKKLK